MADARADVEAGALFPGALEIVGEALLAVVGSPFCVAAFELVVAAAVEDEADVADEFVDAGAAPLSDEPQAEAPSVKASTAPRPAPVSRHDRA